MSGFGIASKKIREVISPISNELITTNFSLMAANIQVNLPLMGDHDRLGQCEFEIQLKQCSVTACLAYVLVSKGKEAFIYRALVEIAPNNKKTFLREWELLKTFNADYTPPLGEITEDARPMIRDAINHLGQICTNDQV